MAEKIKESIQQVAKLGDSMRDIPLSVNERKDLRFHIDAIVSILGCNLAIKTYPEAFNNFDIQEHDNG